MTVLEEYVKAAKDGERCVVDFTTNTMKVNGRPLIDRGFVTGETRELMHRVDIKHLDQLLLYYLDYKYSVPSERSDRCRHPYFKAELFENLSNKELAEGERREVAKARLEGMVLCLKLNGQLKWKTEYGTWFYQNKEDHDFVILRTWIEA